MINFFNNIFDPIVKGEIDIYDFLDRIKRPDVKIKQKIEQARSCYSFDKVKYDRIKGQLPCFTLNFSFREKKENKNIEEPTGFIYIDLDGTTDIDLNNEYIFATWLSLSGTGRGILVKVDGLTLDNFKKTYFEVSRFLNVKPDFRADKATQYCVHSYDNNVYTNNYSKTYQSIEVIKKSPTTVTNIKKEKRVNTVLGGSNKLRFNNISDYDFKDSGYIVFWDEKQGISEVFVPRLIPKGMRETILSTIAYQVRALNNEITKSDLLHLISSINHKKCFPPLEAVEIEKIVKNKMKISAIEPILNKERRIIFAPESKLSRLEKITIVNQTLGLMKMEKSRKTIKKCIDKWDFELLGKITQQKLAKETGLNIKTIEKYYKEFISVIRENNKLFCSHG